MDDEDLASSLGDAFVDKYGNHWNERDSTEQLCRFAVNHLKSHLTTTQSAPSGMRGFTPEEARAYSEGMKNLGHPTGRTFQESAPSVPSVEEIDEAFDRGWYSIIGNEGEENEREQEAFQAGLRAIHALLTERQVGKA